MINIIPIPAFDDNYIWVIRNTHSAAVVDPGDADPVRDYLKHESLQLIAILNTHHHGDHVGGNADLLEHFNVPVYGPSHERIDTVSHPLDEGSEVHLPLLSLRLKVFDIPGHTAGHIGYYGANSLFCGDTLFGCGCGRIFEGTPAQMYASLQKIRHLPDETLVYCAHEYTLSNIRFAKAIEPNNVALLNREKRDQQLRSQHKPTLPSTIGLEKLTNPFLRCGEPDVKASAKKHANQDLIDEIAVFATLREWKNRFT